MEAVVERVNGLLLITEIRVRHRVLVPNGKETAAERALAVHDRECDVSQSVQRGIRVVVDGEVVAD